MGVKTRAKPEDEPEGTSPGMSPGSAPPGSLGHPVPYSSMSQPSMSDVHVPTLLRVVRRRKRRKKKKTRVEKALTFLAKHMGPDDHPSGSSQDVHGRGRQRRDLTSAERSFAADRRQAIQEEISALEEERIRRVHDPDGVDLDAYEALDREIRDAQARYEQFDGRIEEPDYRYGVHRFTGSLTQAQIEGVHSRLRTIDQKRHRLLEQQSVEHDPGETGWADYQDQIDALDLEEGELLIALTTPNLPGIEAPTIRPGAITKPVRNATGKKTGTLTDPQPAEDAYDAHAIFEADIELPTGERYSAVIQQSSVVGDEMRLIGEIVFEGEKVGRFVRSADGIDVWNNEFYIDSEHQGKGIGTMFLSHWEDELQATGYQQMHVTAADIGRYAWAVSGYTWEYPPNQIMDELIDYVQNYNQDMGLDAFTYEPQDGDTEAWNQLREMANNWTEYNEWPEPWELAMVGAGTDEPLGKEVLLRDGMWEGVKWIG